MIGRVASRLTGRSRLTRWLTIAALGLVVVSVLASVTRAPRPEHSGGPPPAAATGNVHTSHAPRHAPLLSAGELARAREAAQRFLDGYLPFVYGRGSVRSVGAVAPSLRQRLTRLQAQVTPVERRRQPRVVSLTVLGRSSRVVLAAALVEDGGVTSYALRMTVEAGPRGWFVSAVDGG